jgi:hypothetical protein
MIWWRPAQTMRGKLWNTESLNAIEMSRLAARLIYGHFCVFPLLLPAENDRDRLKW